MLLTVTIQYKYNRITEITGRYTSLFLLTIKAVSMYKWAIEEDGVLLKLKLREQKTSSVRSPMQVSAPFVSRSTGHLKNTFRALWSPFRGICHVHLWRLEKLQDTFRHFRNTCKNFLLPLHRADQKAPTCK